MNKIHRESHTTTKNNFISMKSIIYILLAVFIISILYSAIPKSVLEQTQTMQIHCTDPAPDPGLLNKSCQIIKSRLENFGIKDAAISVVANQNSIVIGFKSKIDANSIIPLLTSKGRFEFYETYNRADVLNNWNKNDSIFSLLTIPINNAEVKELGSGSILGFSTENNRLTVDRFIRSKQATDLEFDKIKFMWGRNSKGYSKLFLLKKNASLSSSYVKECTGKYYPDSGTEDILISFTTEGAGIWKEMTRQNIGRSIAMVMDNIVYSAPIVKSEIQNGKLPLDFEWVQ